MQVTETSAEGLKRELRVVIPSTELADRFEKKINEVKGQVRLKGFRPGKVPVAHLKRVYGRSVMVDAMQDAVNEANEKALTERNERAAIAPTVKLPEDKEEIEKVLGGTSDLAYDMSFEVLPKFAVTALDQLDVTRPVTIVGDAEIAKSMERLIETQMDFKAEEGRAAATGDRVTIDFEGRVDGELFDGGKGEDSPVVIGRGGFISGFEDGLIGAKAGDQRDVKTTFPPGYPVATLAGKEAVFAVTVKEVAEPVRPTVDDEFAKKFGMELAEKLREAIKGRLEAEFAQASRTKAKRSLLDALDASHAFGLPQTLVDNEFKDIWNQVTEGLKRANRSFADEGKTEEGERAEYQKLAERRVRLGLVLSEIGEQGKIAVTDEELARALAAEARRYRGQEAQVYDFYRKNPRALAQLRAPLYEDKVVNHILGLAKVTDVQMSPEDLLKDSEEDDEPAVAEAHDHDHDHDDHAGHDHR